MQNNQTPMFCTSIVYFLLTKVQKLQNIQKCVVFPTIDTFNLISESKMKTIQSTEVKEIHQKYLLSMLGVPLGQSWLSLNSPFSQASFYRIHYDVLQQEAKIIVT